MTAIIVSYNASPELRRCLRSAATSRGVSLKIVVVDNASTDDNVNMIRDEFPQVDLIVNMTNRGFAAAVNQGLTRATGNIVLLNPDLELEPDTLTALEAALKRHPHVGIVGPALKYPDGSLQPSVKKFPRWIDLLLILTKLPNLWPGLARSYNGLDVDYKREQVVDQVMGSCFMIRQSCLDDVGKFDEGFYIWFEEVDFCKRARDRGWSTLFTPSARARHSRGASFRQLPARRRQRILRRSVVHYCRKHFGWLVTWLLLPGLFVSWLSALMIDAFRLAKPQRAKNF